MYNLFSTQNQAVQINIVGTNLSGKNHCNLYGSYCTAHVYLSFQSFAYGHCLKVCTGLNSFEFNGPQDSLFSKLLWSMLKSLSVS